MSRLLVECLDSWNLDSVGASNSFDWTSDYVGATVYSLPALVEFCVDCSYCTYNFKVPGWTVFSLTYLFRPTNLCGSGHCVFVLRFACYFSHLRLLVHSCVGVLDPQDQCAVVTLVVNTSFSNTSLCST